MRVKISDEIKAKTFGLRVFFFRETRQRCDVDNLLKAVQDAGNKIIWGDDSQIHEIFGRLFYDKENPRIEVMAYLTEPVGDVASRVKYNCVVCDKEMTTYRSSSRLKNKLKIYCSRECFKKIHIGTAICKGCGVKFEAAISKLKAIKGFCSRKCGIDYWQAHRPDSSRNWICHTCGKNVSRKEYTRCLSCAMKSREPISNRWENRNILNPHKVEEGIELSVEEIGGIK